VVFDTVRIQGKSGVRVTANTAIVVTFQDGKIIRFEDFGERVLALKAVGLKEDTTDVP
jgi:ketosteroid isomerase-like protein